ncbi:hypothetical protein [Flavobacterium cupreum]|nr:hypothetical protein [Flavobacterium cupreum]
MRKKGGGGKKIAVQVRTYNVLNDLFSKLLKIKLSNNYRPGV